MKYNTWVCDLMIGVEQWEVKESKRQTNSKFGGGQQVCKVHFHDSVAHPSSGQHCFDSHSQINREPR